MLLGEDPNIMMLAETVIKNTRISLLEQKVANQLSIIADNKDFQEQKKARKVLQGLILSTDPCQASFSDILSQFSTAAKEEASHADDDAPDSASEEVVVKQEKKVKKENHKEKDRKKMKKEQQ